MNYIFFFFFCFCSTSLKDIFCIFLCRNVCVCLPGPLHLQLPPQLWDIICYLVHRKWPLSFHADVLFSVKVFACWRCHHSVPRSWFFLVERWTSSLSRSCWTFSEITKSPRRWCSSCGLVVRSSPHPELILLLLELLRLSPTDLCLTSIFYTQIINTKMDY